MNYEEASKAIEYPKKYADTILKRFSASEESDIETFRPLTQKVNFVFISKDSELGSIMTKDSQINNITQYNNITKIDIKPIAFIIKE